VTCVCIWKQCIRITDRSRARALKSEAQSFNLHEAIENLNISKDSGSNKALLRRRHLKFPSALEAFLMVLPAALNLSISALLKIAGVWPRLDLLRKLVDLAACSEREA
jgi:hypothetical protein